MTPPGRGKAAPRRENGSAVTRAELGAHLERLDASIQSLHDKIDSLTDFVRAPPKWAIARLTALVDKAFIVGATAFIAYIIVHSS